MMARLQSLMFWLSVPLLLPQALYVRKTAPRFAAAEGPSSGASGTGNTVRLLAIGDSIIAGVGATTLANALLEDGRDKRALQIALKAAKINDANPQAQLIIGSAQISPVEAGEVVAPSDDECPMVPEASSLIRCSNL